MSRITGGENRGGEEGRAEEGGGRRKEHEREANKSQQTQPKDLK